MSAYKIKININDTPEQEVFISFQCSVQSVPIVDNENISFKSQVTEFNGKTRTEIPITCVSSIYDDRMFSKINKLQKGNKVEIVGNLIKNDKEEIVVLVTYIVYFNANNFSNYDKKDLSKIPWLDSSNFTKKIPMKINHMILLIIYQTLLTDPVNQKFKILIPEMKLLLFLTMKV